MKTILLTGDRGFVGKNIIQSLSKRFKILTLNGSSDNIESYNLDESMIDTVVHLSAKTFVPDSFEKPYDFFQFNINASLAVAEFCRVKKVKKLIYINSYPYGNPDYLPVDERHRIKLYSPYNKSKHLGEETVFKYLDGSFTKVISLRLLNLFGAGQNKSFLISQVLEEIEKSSSITVQDFKPKRDFLYIKDFISLVEKIVMSDVDKSDYYNVGSGKSYSVKEIVDTINFYFNNSLKIQCKDIERENEILDCYMDITKVSNQFLWKPQFTLKDGLKEMLNERF